MHAYNICLRLVNRGGAAGAGPYGRGTLGGGLLALFSSCLMALPAAAQNATWLGNNAPGPIEWTQASNWSPATVPTDTATFDNTAAIHTAQNNGGAVTINQIDFAAGAALPFTILVANNFTVQGAGITNESGLSQTFTISGATLFFTNSATVAPNVAFGLPDFSANLDFQNTSSAGSSSITNGGITLFSDSASAGNASIDNSGTLSFTNSSTAANASITDNGLVAFANTSTAAGATITGSGSMTFNDSAAAGSANIQLNGAVAAVTFADTSTADHSTIDVLSGTTFLFSGNSSAANATISYGAGAFAGGPGAFMEFHDSATAGNATIIMTHGVGDVLFFDSSTGGNARFIGDPISSDLIDISGLTTSGMTMGSIEGGNVFVELGSKQLTIGGNNLSTTFDGVFADGGGSGGTGGSLVKVGTGTLELDNASTYTGGTTISGGVLAFGGTNGGVAGNIVDNATLAFNYTADATVSNDISGSGGVQQAGAVVVTLTGSNTYNGPTTVSAGTFRAGASSVLSPTSDVTVASGATLDVNNFSETIGSLAGAGNVTLGPSGQLITANPTTTTFSGVISGGPTSFFELDGGGTMTLSGTNTLSGTVFVNPGSILHAGIANTIANANLRLIGQATFDLNNFNQTIGTLSSFSPLGQITLGSATLTTNSASSSTFLGVISGTGGLTKAGTGTLKLQNTNTYTGPTTVNAGTLQMGVANALSASTDLTVASGATFDLNNLNQTVGSLAGAGNVTLGSATLSANADNASTTFSGAISGSGGLTKIGTGTLTLTGTNSYTGGTTISAGVLALSGSGSLLGSVTDNATFEFELAAASTFSGDISGSGILHQAGPGTLILTGNNSYTGGTTVDPATNLQVGNGGTSGSIGTGAVLDNGTLIFDRSDALTFAPPISGSGALMQEGTNTLTLTANNTFAGGTTIAPSSTLQLGNGGTTGAVTGNVVDNGTLVFDRSDNVIFGGTISGSGAVMQSGPDTLIFTADNSYSGTTTIAPGSTLQLGAGGTSGAIVSNVVDNGTLVFDRSDTVTYAGTISGNGGVDQIGTGTTILTGASTYSGPTLVDAGVLDVNGSIANSIVTLSQGGTLKGNGTVGGITVGSGATVAPGNSIGTMHVAGNVNFGANSVYQVEVNAAGQSDLIVASGSATLTGGVVQVLAPPGVYAPSTTYTILTTATGVNGTFASVTSDNPLLFPTLSYKPDEVDLTLIFKSLPTFATTPNQAATAAAIQGNGSGALFVAILSAGVADIPAALDATSGEIHASMRSALLEQNDTLRQTVLDRLQEARNSTASGIWGRIFGSWGAIAGDGNAATLDTSFSGATIGADMPIGDAIRVGVDGGYGLTSAIAPARGSSLQSDSYHLGVYGSFGEGPFALDAGVIGSWGNIRTDREVRFTGFSDSDRAKQSSRTTQAFAQASYDLPLGNADLAPFVNGGWIEANTGAFSETGGTAALSGTRGQSDETFMTLGTRLSTDIALANGGTITPNATLGWLHGFHGLTPSRFLTFEATGQSFNVFGVPLDKDEAVIDVAVSAHPVPGLRATIGYDGILSGRVRDNGIHASLAWEF